jgi:hypothetical protein
MTVMLFAQVICSVLLSIPLSIEKIYSVFKGHHQESNEQKELEDFLGLIVVLITLMNSSLAFYIFTLTGQVFREELKRIFCFQLAAPMATVIVNQTNARR